MPRSVFLEAFAKAIQLCDIQGAMKAAKSLREDGREIGIREALDLVVLLFQQRDYRAQKAGEHWIEMLVAKGCKDIEVQIAMAAMEGMKDRETAVRCEKVLKILAYRIWPE